MTPFLPRGVVRTNELMSAEGPEHRMDVRRRLGMQLASVVTTFLAFLSRCSSKESVWHRDWVPGFQPQLPADRCVTLSEPVPLSGPQFPPVSGEARGPHPTGGMRIE